MRHILPVLACLTPLLMLTPSPADADAGPVAAPEADAAMPDEKLAGRAELARDLVTRAREDSAPEMMVVAATILRDHAIILVPAENTPMIMGRARRSDEMPVIDASMMLNEAREMAQGDPGLLDWIDREQAAAAKGILPESIAYTHDLQGGRVLTMRARAQGGRLALVRVRGDGDAPLALDIVASDGKVACTDEQTAGSFRDRRDLVCRWTPSRTDTYRIRVRNDGRIWSRMILVSN